jgi:hypothetical protein
MGYSKHRKKTSRRQGKKIAPAVHGGWLLSGLQDPRLSGGGAGAMIIAATSVEISGSARMAAVFFAIAWLFLAWTFYEKGWFAVRTRLNVIAVLAVIAIGFGMSWWALIPPHPPSAAEIAAEINKSNVAPIASLRDAAIQIDRLVFTKDTSLPFAPGQDIALNFTYSNTGTAAALNLHVHGRATFIKTMKNPQEEPNRVFSEIYEEIGNFYSNNREGFTVAPSDGQGLNYSSLLVKSPSKDDIDGFYKSERQLLVALRIEHDYIHYVEYCSVFDRDSLDEFLTTGNLRVVQCYSHNRSATHPVGRVF